MPGVTVTTINEAPNLGKISQVPNRLSLVILHASSPWQTELVFAKKLASQSDWVGTKSSPSQGVKHDLYSQTSQNAAALIDNIYIKRSPQGPGRLCS